MLLCRGGSIITVASTRPGCIHFSVVLTTALADGPRGSTNGCTAATDERDAGEYSLRNGHRGSSLIGDWACGPEAGQWEPCESRDSCTVPREPRGEIPLGYSPLPTCCGTVCFEPVSCLTAPSANYASSHGIERLWSENVQPSVAVFRRRSKAPASNSAMWPATSSAHPAARCWKHSYVVLPTRVWSPSWRRAACAASARNWSAHAQDSSEHTSASCSASNWRIWTGSTP